MFVGTLLLHINDQQIQTTSLELRKITNITDKEISILIIKYYQLMQTTIVTMSKFNNIHFAK